MPYSPECGPRVTPGSHEADERRLPRRLAGAVHHCHGFCLGHPDVHARAWRRAPSGGPGPQARGTSLAVRLCPTEHPFVCGVPGRPCSPPSRSTARCRRIPIPLARLQLSPLRASGRFPGGAADPSRTHPADGGPPPTHRIGQGPVTLDHPSPASACPRFQARHPQPIATPDRQSSPPGILA